MNILIFLAALSYVESNHNDLAIGDEGRAYGRYQMHQAALTEANRRLGTYYQLRDLKSSIISKRCAIAYLERLEALRPPDVDRAEWLARCWNGGPRGYFKKDTLPYWKKVKRAMKSPDVRKVTRFQRRVTFPAPSVTSAPSPIRFVLP